MKKRLLNLLLLSFYVVSLATGVFTEHAHAAVSQECISKTPSGIAFDQMEETIDEYVSEYIGKTTPGAAIAIIKDGEVIFLKGYGYADMENNVPVDPKSTVFEWASMSKLFTWTSVMQLVEQGKLDLDASITTYLPQDFIEQLDLKQDITMRNIMNHSAGFGDYAFNTIGFTPDQVVSLEEAILRDKPKQYYEVGTASAYSNYATSLAGFIVQTISGQRFEDYEREQIFDVLSMNNTTSYTAFDDNKELPKQKAKGYLSDHQGNFQLGHWSYISHAPAGSINGTVEDFAQYALALTPKNAEKSPLFKEAKTLSTMLSPSYDVNGESVGSYHGFFEYLGASPAYGHGGNTAGFSSQFAIVPEEGFGFVILTNAYQEMNLMFGLQDLLLGKDRSSVAVPDINLPSSSDVAGHYVPMQRQEGNFVDFAKYISLYKIEALDTNKITMSLGPYNATYLQTKPYTYELIHDNLPLFRNAYSLLKFRVEDGSVKQILVGHGLDLSALPQGRTMPFLIGSMVVLLTSILFFFVAPLVLLIVALKNRKKGLDVYRKRFNRYHSLLVLAGTMTLINNLTPSAMIMINNFRTFAEVKPYIIFNYPLLLITFILSILSLKSMKKTCLTKTRTIMYVMTLIMLVLLFATFIGWNYFAIVG